MDQVFLFSAGTKVWIHNFSKNKLWWLKDILEKLVKKGWHLLGIVFWDWTLLCELRDMRSAFD